MPSKIFQAGTIIDHGWLNDVNTGIFNAASKIGTAIRTLLDKLSDTICPEDFGAVGDGVTDDVVALRAMIAYCLANNIKEARGRRVYATSGPIDISNFSYGFRLFLGGLNAAAAFPAITGNWKSTATALITVGTGGGSQVGLSIDIGRIDGGNKADGVWITNNGCGGSKFNFDRAENCNIIVKMTGNTFSTASNYFTGSYWFNSTMGALVVGSGGVCEGTTFDVNFISGCKYGGLVFGNRSQYAKVTGQLDFNGSWVTEVAVSGIGGFNVGDQLNNGSGSYAELLALYIHQGQPYLLIIETRQTQGGLTNFAVGNNLTNGTAVSAIVGISTANQGSNSRYFDIISALTPSEPFWRALVLCAYLGGIVGSNLWNCTVDSGNSASSYTSWFAGLEVYNSGSILSMADKRKADASFLDVTDDYFAIRRRAYIGTNQIFGIEASAVCPNSTTTAIANINNGGVNGAVWKFWLQDTTAGIYAEGVIRVPVSGTTGTITNTVTPINCSLTMSGLALNVTQGTGASRSVYVNLLRVI